MSTGRDACDADGDAVPISPPPTHMTCSSTANHSTSNHSTVYSLLVGSWSSLKMLQCNILRELQLPTNSEYTTGDVYRLTDLMGFTHTPLLKAYNVCLNSCEWNELVLSWKPLLHRMPNDALLLHSDANWCPSAGHICTKLHQGWSISSKPFTLRL